MSEAPEKIWACHAHDGRLIGTNDGEVSGWTEYIRSDLHDALRKDADHQCRERVKEFERANKAEAEIEKTQTALQCALIREDHQKNQAQAEAAERLAGARVKGELDKLSTFFRDEAPSDGFEGDVEGWSPVDTAIAVMRRNRPAERRVKVGDIVRIIALWSDDEGLELSFNQGDDLARRLLSALAEPAGEVEPVAWRSVDCAPKDGTMLRLLVRPGRAEEDGWTPFADSSDPYQTIGFNALSDTGEDEWQFAGWDWCHDCFTDGAGEVVGWLPFEATPSAIAIREALPATGPYVDRLIRIFRDKPDDDTSAVVLQDYARAALAGAKP